MNDMPVTVAKVLGAGTTDYLAYAENVVAGAGSIAVGGDHVTNDVAIAVAATAANKCLFMVFLPF